MKKALNIIKSYGFSVCIVIFVMLLAISFKSTLKTDAVWSTALADVVALFFCLGQYLVMRNKDMDADFLKPRFKFSVKKFAFVIGSAIVFSYFALTAINYLIIVLHDANMDSRIDTFSNHSTFTIGFISVVISPIVEEVMYRLYIYNNTKRVSHWLPAMLFTSLLFAFAHGTYAHMIIATAFGIFLTVVYELTERKLWVCILCHAIHNLMSMVLPVKVYFITNTTVVMISFMILSAFCVFGIGYLHGNYAKFIESKQSKSNNKR